MVLAKYTEIYKSKDVLKYLENCANVEIIDKSQASFFNGTSHKNLLKVTNLSLKLDRFDYSTSEYVEKFYNLENLEIKAVKCLACIPYIEKAP